MHEILKTHKREIYDPQNTFEVPVQMVINRPSRDLENFLDFLAAKVPEQVPDFVEQLSARLSEFESMDVKEVPFAYTPQNIEKYPTLFEKVRGVGLSLLKYQEHISQEKEGKVAFRQWDLIRSYLIPLYLAAETLASINSRIEALDLCKDAMDYLVDQNSGELPPVQDMNQAYVMHVNAPANVGTLFLTNNGIAGFKVTRCMWADILKEFHDPELTYVVACHADFRKLQNANNDFRLTRTKTLMQGGEMCDHCWHDITIDKEMKHPSDDFWRNLDNA